MDSLNNRDSGNEDLDKPIPIDDLDKPIPFDNESDVKPSRSPSGSGGGGVTKMPAVGPSSRPIGPIAKKTAEKIVSTDRITGVKTFLAKLHVGSIDFIDQQIREWLKNNPGVAIKRTNTTTGMVVGKKTEPHIIVTVWY